MLKLGDTFNPANIDDVVYIGGNAIRTDKKMRPRDPHDFYETDESCLRAYFTKVSPRNTWTPDHIGYNILDPSAGRGVWGRVLSSTCPNVEYIVGNDIQDVFTVDAALTYTTWLQGDFLKWDDKFMRPDGVLLDFDLIATNPPYKYAEEFFWKSRQLVHRDGSIIFLLRLGFLASERRAMRMWGAGYTPSMITVCSTRPSFSGDGKTYPGDFAFFRWDFQNGTCTERAELNFLVYDRDGE